MSLTNNTQLQPPNRAQLEDMFEAASKPMKSSKQDTLLAVGEIAMIFQAALMHPTAREYSVERIKNRNTVIEQYNKGLDAKASDYNQKRKLPIKEPDAATMSAEAINKALLRGVVRVAGEHDSASEQSHVSRHETAVRFVFRRANNAVIQTARDAADLISAVGGLDRAIQIERGSGQASTKLTAAVDKTIREGISDKLTTAGATSTVACAQGDDGPRLIIARRSGSKMHIIAETPIQSEKEAARLRPFASNLYLPEDPKCELLKRVADLSSLVPKGAPTLRYLDDNHGGARRKVERVLVLRPTDKHGGMLVISALPTVASPIVLVTPKAPVVFATPSGSLVLCGKDLEALTDRYAARDVYRFESIVEELPTWTSTTSVLEKGDPEKELQADWLAIDPKDPPLEVHDFSNDASASFNLAQLNALNKDCLKAGAGGDVYVGLSSTQDRLRFEVNPSAALSYPAVLTNQTPFAISFRLSELTAIVDALVRDGVSKVDISADAEGPLRFAWKDHLASYEVYLPQVMDSGSSDPRKMRKIKH